MPHSKLVENTSVGCGEVCHRILAQNQLLEHRLVNGSSRHLFIGTNGLEVGFFYGRSNEIAVHRVKIDFQATGV
jgi:hypothetical protein